MQLDELYILNSFKITQNVKTSSGNFFLWQRVPANQPFVHTVKPSPKNDIVCMSEYHNRYLVRMHPFTYS
jgi:hypothetical protein